MFKKVLVVEDHESINISVQRCLTDLGIPNDHRNNVFYCDDAIKRIKRAMQENEPYDLMITDLSFDSDGSEQVLTNGKDLIKAVRELQPELKIVVFSIENRFEKIKPLFQDLGVNAFVPKARQDAKDLKLAVETIYEDREYYSPNIKKDYEAEQKYSFTDYDKFLLKLLANGKRQIDFPKYLDKEGFKPSGLSSVEKRLKSMRESLKLSTNEQLLAFAVEEGII